MNRLIAEPAREIRVAGEYDLIVCGGGPAGVSAAITAARLGVKTLLIERGGSLGGIWTSGMLCLVLDTKYKGGLLQEIKEILEKRNAIALRNHSGDFLYDVESMKLLLDELTMEAGVTVRLHTRVVSVAKRDGRIEAIITESASGREAFAGSLILDSSGNGDVGFQAGVTFESGHPLTGVTQPATLFAIIQGVPSSQPPTSDNDNKQQFRSLLRSAGIDPSYQSPSLFKLPVDGLYCLMINHEYAVPCDDNARITEATIHARREINDTVTALQKLPGWENARLVTTAEAIGMREGRRLKGLYRLDQEAIASGAKFEDGICTVYFPVDIHALDAKSDIGFSHEGVSVKPYHIPLRSLLSAEIPNLAFAGRCVSGDFYAHASYRVTGNAVAMGEAVGIAAAEVKAQAADFRLVDGAKVSQEMMRRGYH